MEDRSAPSLADLAHCFFLLGGHPYPVIRALLRKADRSKILRQTNTGVGEFALSSEAVLHERLAHLVYFLLRQLSTIMRSTALPLRILLADDSKTSQALLAGLLRSDRPRVTLVANGREAVDAITEEEFDVVLMDVEMPVMDGLAATRLIRSGEANSHGRLPIIGVTDGGTSNECLDAGMDAFLPKPVSADSLRKTLEQVVQN